MILGGIDMSKPLMPKATAVWLIDNTTLTFEQISDFCGLHILEVKGIADGEVASGITGMSPVTAGQLTSEEIEICEKNPKRTPKLSDSARRHIEVKKKKKKTAKYTPVARRQDKPDAIAWITKNHPDMSTSQIEKLIGTTKNTINAIRERTHWNITNIKPRDPVLLGLCTQIELDKAISRIVKTTKSVVVEPEPQADTKEN